MTPAEVLAALDYAPPERVEVVHFAKPKKVAPAPAQLATVGISHRATTSSRHPGRVFEGAVKFELRRAVKCPDCGGMRRGGAGAHAPRWADRDGRHVQVDCVGRELTREGPLSS